MSLVLEGCDLTGKSTLARTLGWNIIRKGAKRGIESTVDSTCKIPAGQNIWGRCWLTEMVYGYVLRGSKGFTNTQLWQMGMHYETVGAVMLLLDLPIDEIERRFSERGDSELTLDQILQVRSYYLEMSNKVNRFLPPVCRNDLIQALFLHDKRYHRIRELGKYGHSGWGSLTPKVLFIVSDEVEYPPFYYPEAEVENVGGAAFYDALTIAGLGPRDIRVISNYVIDDWHATRALIGAEKVIALGSEGHSLSLYKTIEHLQHPSEIKTEYALHSFAKSIKDIHDDCTRTSISS